MNKKTNHSMDNSMTASNENSIAATLENAVEVMDNAMETMSIKTNTMNTTNTKTGAGTITAVSGAGKTTDVMGAGTKTTAPTTLWQGELEYWMDEAFIAEKWLELSGETVVSVKIIRDKFSGLSLGYCFVDFGNHETAEKCLNTFNGTLIPGTQKTKLRLNWATGGSSGVSSGTAPTGPEYSIFVGDLSLDVGDDMLLNLFQTHYQSVRSAKVVLDMSKGISKGYGFVRFGDESEQKDSLKKMMGKICGSRPIRVSVATPKNNRMNIHSYPMMSPYHDYNTMGYDTQNTTVFVGGLASSVTEQELENHFSSFGDISYVKIPLDMGCGFVSFASRYSAEMAIQQMAGVMIGGQPIRLSWGNSQHSSNSMAAAYYYPTVYHPQAHSLFNSPISVPLSYIPQLHPHHHLVHQQPVHSPSPVSSSSPFSPRQQTLPYPINQDKSSRRGSNSSGNQEPDHTDEDSGMTVSQQTKDT